MLDVISILKKLAVLSVNELEIKIFRSPLKFLWPLMRKKSVKYR
jgi:hypothetical protein